MRQRAWVGCIAFSYNHQLEGVKVQLRVLDLNKPTAVCAVHLTARRVDCRQERDGEHQLNFTLSGGFSPRVTRGGMLWSTRAQEKYGTSAGHCFTHTISAHLRLAVDLAFCSWLITHQLRC